MNGIHKHFCEYSAQTTPIGLLSVPGISSSCSLVDDKAFSLLLVLDEKSFACFFFFVCFVFSGRRGRVSKEEDGDVNSEDC